MILYLFVLLNNQAISQTHPFIETQNNFHGIINGDLAWGDYDNDGDLDILLTGTYLEDEIQNYIVTIYRNDGYDIFSETSIDLPTVFYGSANWGDYDNDGDLDFLLTGSYASVGYITKIFNNSGSGTFTDLNLDIVGVASSSSGWADFDNDSDLDFIISGQYVNSDSLVTIIYSNIGNNQFIAVNDTLIGFSGCSIALGDYDNDMDIDIAIGGYAEYENRTTIIFKNTGDFIFEKTEIELVGCLNGSLCWGDYDSDGDLDLLITGMDNDSDFGSYIYKNEGLDSFTKVDPGFKQLQNSDCAWIDFDNDGDLDVHLIGRASGTWVSNNLLYKNEGNDIFTEIATGMDIVRSGVTRWADYDNDNDMDVIFCGVTSGDIWITKLYRNDGSVYNTKPDPPINLGWEQIGRTIYLYWDASNDIQTNTNSLTYNIRIGSTSGAINILSPMTDISTGLRQISAMGNTNINTSWKIDSLPEGTYYWSAQALDNSYAGSEFSSEATFDITDISVSENSYSDLWIYPNPNSGSFFIEGINGEQVEGIYNLYGKNVVNSFIISFKNDEVVHIVNKVCLKGIYLLKIKYERKEKTLKILIR